jgi:hypothetical protein
VDDQVTTWMFGDRRRTLAITGVMALAGAAMGLLEGAPAGFVATVVALYLVIQGIIGEHVGRGVRRQAAERAATAGDDPADEAIPGDGPDVELVRVPVDEPERHSSPA